MMEQSKNSPGVAPQNERVIPEKIGEGLIENLEQGDLTTHEFDYVVDRLEKDTSQEEFDFITQGEKILADEIAKNPNAQGVEGKLAQARFTDAVKKLKRQFTSGVKVALISAFSLLAQQGSAQNSETKNKTEVKTETKKIEAVTTADPRLEFHEEMRKDVEDYTTKDGNFRRYHNPKSGWLTSTGQEKVTYAYGATESPFKTLEEMKEKTRIPKSLGETDFFTNYINALSETDSVIEDPETGNRYFDYHATQDSLATGVPYLGDKHWNVNRFLIQPHYRDFDNVPSKEQARVNALFDMYKYFLYQEKGNRDVAWEKANDFISKEVDSVVESKAEHWFEENYPIINGDGPSNETFLYLPTNIYQSDNTTTFVESIFRHNSDVFLGKKQAKVYSKQEIQDMLTDYNISFRKKTPEEAAQIAKASVDDAEQKVKKAIQDAQDTPLSKQSITFKNGFTKLPDGFDSWDPILQNDWMDENAVTTNEYSQADKDKYVKLFSSWRFAE